MKKELIEEIKSRPELQKAFVEYRSHLLTFAGGAEKINDPDTTVSNFLNVERQKNEEKLQRSRCIGECAVPEKRDYVLLKSLPDADAGTKVIWDEAANAFYYEKSSFVSPHEKNYLTAGTVTQSPEWFREEVKQPPLGIKPLFLHNEQRLDQINAAIERYTNTGFAIPNEWILEKQYLENNLLNRNEK